MSETPRTAAQAAGESTEQKIARLERELAAALKANEILRDGRESDARAARLAARLYGEQIADLRKAKEEAERTADITMTGFGKLEEKFREQVLRAEEAGRNAERYRILRNGDVKGYAVMQISESYER